MLYDLDNPYATAVEAWLLRVVIGLNLCPFAQWPFERGQVRIAVTKATDDKSLLDDIDAEFSRLNNTAATKLETTLFVMPHYLDSFDRYLDMLSILDHSGWEGIFQIATFHPDYVFDGDEPDAVENYTNRAPYPIFHLLREDSLEKSLQHYRDPETIPERNIQTLRTLSAQQLATLFGVN